MDIFTVAYGNSADPPNSVKVVDSSSQEFLVPIDPENRVWRRVLVWVDNGGVIGAFVADDPDPIISFSNFEDRFTASEWNDTTDFVYEVNPDTGAVKQRVLIQELARMTAKGNVDLTASATDDFLTKLVNGGVITSDRRDAILVP